MHVRQHLSCITTGDLDIVVLMSNGDGCALELCYKIVEKPEVGLALLI